MCETAGCWAKAVGVQQEYQAIPGFPGGCSDTLALSRHCCSLQCLLGAWLCCGSAWMALLFRGGGQARYFFLPLSAGA